jgi:hypothetical protein
MSADRVMELIQTHMVRYPESGIMDVYKLLHQGTFGPGHLIASRKAAREWLEQEIGLLTPSTNEPLIESVHPDGAIVRLHLRPYVAYRGKVRPLLMAFVRSAEQIQGELDTMARRWEQFDALCQPDGRYTNRFPLREVRLFGRVRAKEDWPAIHHSPGYNAAYRPRYRVLTRAEAEALCEKISAPCEVV